MHKAIAALIALAGASHAAAQLATIEYVGVLDPAMSYGVAYAVDDEGRCVAGTSGLLDAQTFRWSTSVGIHGLGFLPHGFLSEGYGISGDGRVVVGESMTLREGGLGWEAFRWTEATGMQALGDLTGDPSRPESRAHDASHDGAVIVGDSDSPRAPNGREAFVWTEAGGMVGLGDLPGGAFESRAFAVSADGEKVVGWAKTASGAEAFIWTSATGMIGLGTLAGDDSSSATSISHDGRTVVGATESRAFVWTEEGGMHPLPGLGFGTMRSRGVDADGGIVVGEWNWVQNHLTHHAPFIWTRHLGTRELSDVLASRYGLVLGQDWTLRSAWGISADGRTIVGEGETPINVQGFVLRLQSPLDCYGDFFPDGMMDVYDYFHFATSFVAGSRDTDCDRNGVFDILDFLCFQDAFAAGC